MGGTLDLFMGDLLYSLEKINDKLSLVINGSRFKPLTIDFIEGKARHRREYGGGRGQLIAKAIGIKKRDHLSVLDLTAGLGHDAFVLACLGCHVTMVERSLIVAALLEDALRRLKEDSELLPLSLQLIQQDAFDYLQQLHSQPDVIYLDPMYPDSKNTAQPKKEMQILRELLGHDQDAAKLMPLALAKAKHRVVVKRPRHGERLIDRDPDVVYAGKSSRFDVYIGT